ncbi:MAG: nuclear transport factor 2 family protein [Nesterenkonia sp.]
MVLNELLDLEHRGWQSLCESSGADFYGQLMLDDGVMVLAHGYVFDRTQVIDSLNDAPAWSHYEITEPRLLELTAECAVLAYRGTAWRSDTEPVFRAWMSSVYVKQDGRWRLASYQQTPIPG